MRFPAITWTAVRRAGARARALGVERLRTIEWRSRRTMLGAGVAAVLGLAALVTTVVVTRSGPNDAKRAIDALAPPNRVLHIVARSEETTVTIDAALSRSESSPVVVRSEEWSTSGPGAKLLSRRITAPPGAAGDPPTEDVLFDREASGATRLLATWDAPESGATGGTLTLGATQPPSPVGYGWAQVIRDAYLASRLGSAGKTMDGDPLFIGASLIPASGETRPDDCADTELILDPRTFLPRSMTTETGCPISGQTTQVTRIAVTFEEIEVLSQTPETMAALRLGPWPVTTALEADVDGGLTSIPPAAALATMGTLRAES